MDLTSNSTRHLYPRARGMAARGLALALALIFISHLAAAGTAAAPAATVRIDPADLALSVGATTVVNVRIENVNALAGAEVHLTYNPALLGVQKIEGGGFPSPDFVAQSKFGGGKIDYAIAQMPNQHSPANGSGSVLKITLEGKGNGVSPLQFKSVILANPAGQAIPVAAQDGQIAVGSLTPSSTPANENDWLQPLRSFFDWLGGLFR